MACAEISEDLPAPKLGWHSHNYSCMTSLDFYRLAVAMQPTYCGPKMGNMKMEGLTSKAYESIVTKTKCSLYLNSFHRRLVMLLVQVGQNVQLVHLAINNYNLN